MSYPGAGWIPPEFREHVIETVSEEEAQALVGSIGWYDEQGVRHETPIEELRKKQKIVAVIDTRTGERHNNLSKVPFVNANFNV
jgi:hypothetical protein